MKRAIIISCLLALGGCNKPPAPSPPAPAKSSKYPEQVSRYEKAEIRADAVGKADKAVSTYLLNQRRYELVAKGGVPAAVIAGLHMREADFDFKTHLANGDSLQRMTVHVPKGRIPGKNPPYTWEEGADDALYVVDRMQDADWLDLGAGLEKIELYNGPGYKKRGLPSPYLYAGTTEYERGKFIRDGVFSETTVDKQLGVAALLKRMEERGVKAWPSMTFTVDRNGKVVAVVWLNASVEF